MIYSRLPLKYAIKVALFYLLRLFCFGNFIIYLAFDIYYYRYYTNYFIISFLYNTLNIYYTSILNIIY